MSDDAMRNTFRMSAASAAPKHPAATRITQSAERCHGRKYQVSVHHSSGRCGGARRPCFHADAVALGYAAGHGL